MKLTLSLFLVIGLHLCIVAQPTTGASNFSVTNLDGDRFRVNWTRGNGSQILVIASQSPTFGGSGTPANGIDYTSNAQFGSGNLVGAGNFVVYKGAGANVTVTGLVHSTTYYFRLFEFNGTGTGTLYNTVSVLSGNGTTLSPPSSGSTSLVATPTGNTASLTWTRGNGSRSLVVLQVGSTPGNPVDYTNYSPSATFTSGSVIGSGYAVHFNSTNTVNVINLQPNTTYFYKVVEANGTTGPVYDLSNSLTGSFTTGGAPTGSASSFSTNNLDGNSFRINWVRGNGTQVLVVASLSPTFNGAGLPSNATDYIANAQFGLGNPVGSGNFVVYEGTGTTVTVTGLTHSTTYYFRVFEFNGVGTNTFYNTTSFLSGNGSTLFPPTAGSTNLIATPTGNTASLTWTRGNGSRSLVILQAGSSPANPTDYTNYSPSATFGSGSAIGSGRVVYFNNSNTVNVTNLSPNTTYFYKVVESNGPSGPAFDLTNALTGSFTTIGAPTAGSTTFNASNVEGASFNIFFNIGNGSRRLVVVRQDLAVTWTPTDGVDYNVSSTFGLGDNLGGNTFAVADFAGSSTINVSGLTPATTYHVAVFEYNGVATNTFYLTTPAQVLKGSVTTLSPPSVSTGNPTFSAINGYKGTVTFAAGNGVRRIVLAKAGSPVTDVPVNLVNYSSNAYFPSAPVLGASRIVYEGNGTTFTVTALQPNTTYHFAIFEYNGNTGPVYKQADPATGSFTTEGKPTVLPTSLTYSAVQGNTMLLNYTAGNGFGRIIIAKQGSPVDVFPSDLTSYTANTIFGTAAAHLGGGNYVIENDGALGTASNTPISNLTIGQTYYFAIVEYNGTGTQRIYVTPAEALTGSQVTLSQPTVQASNISFTGITATSVTVNWQNGDGERRMVLIRQGQAVTSLPVNLTPYSSNSSYPSSPSLGTSRIVYNTTGNSVTVTNLSPAEYHFAVVEYNGSTGPVYRTSDPLNGVVVVGDRPSVPATNLVFSSINGNSVNLSFTRGNGLGRMIIAKQGSPVDAWPLDNTGYTANSFGTGSNLGGGNFVVAQTISTTASFNITGLQPTTNYHFAVVEFNGSGSSALYQLPAIVATANQNTLSAPTQTTSSFFGTSITGNRMNLSWTNGNGAGRLIVAKAGSPVDVNPSNLVDYSSSTVYGSGANLGGGNFAVFDAAATNFLLTNLQPATTYHFASFEYNGTGSGKVYLTSSVGRTSFTTAPRPSVAPKNLVVADVNGDRFSVALTVGNGTRRLIVLRKGGLVNAVPADLTTYTPGAFGAGTQIGTGNYVTSLISSGGAVQITGLEPNTEYGVAVFELDGAAGNERYLVTEYINQLVKTSVTPTISTFSLLYNSVGSTSINLSWTNGNGQARMVVLRPYQPVTFSPVNLNSHGSASANYTSATVLTGDHRHIMRSAATTVNITNLAPGTTYHVAIYEFNGLNQPVYTSTPLRGFFTTLPTTGLAIGGFDAITFCPAQQVDVPYFFTGVLNTGNQLSIELSDITGSFASPTVIGVQSTTNTTGFITSTLPAALPEGIGYRLRVSATNPANTSPTNGVNLQIATSVVPTITVVGGQTSSCGTPIQLSTSQPGYNLQWFRNSTPIPLATNSSFFATTSGTYQVRIAGASGGCQLISTSTTLTITTAPVFDLQFSSVYCDGQVIDLSSLVQPAGGTFTGSGITGSTFNASTAGVGQHIITYTYTDAVSSCSYSSAKQIRVAALPDAPTTTGATGCNQSSVILEATGAQSGDTYSWYTDATGTTPIAGAVFATYTTPELSTTTTFYVSINNGTCESLRATVTATILPAVTPPLTTGDMRCTNGSVTLTASGSTDGNYRWYTQASGGTAISGEVNATFTTPSITSTTTYYVSIIDGCESSRTSVIGEIRSPLATPSVAGASNCGSGTVKLTAAGGSDGEYRWYTEPTGGIAINGEVNAEFTTPSITSTTIYYVSLNNGCESNRAPVTAEIKTKPAAPSATGQNACGTSNVTLSASGGSDGQYRWYTEATGGVSLSGEVNSTLTISSLSVTTSYYVSILNDCESERTMATATIFTPPVKPVVSSSLPPNGSTIAICKDPLTLNGPVGFTSYKWSTGATTTNLVITSPESNLSLIVTDANNCSSPSSDAFDIVALASCTNSAPTITTTNLNTALEGSVTINLLSLISDDDDNLDPNSLRVVTQPSSGAVASIDAKGNLVIDYKGVSFSGRDRVEIEACDLSGVCTQQEITIDVAGDVVVYNGISPNGDGKNDFLLLQYIDVLEETKNNKVSIFNRWGDVVFEVSNYNNTNNYFAGLNKNGNELPSGNYFYKIDYGNGKKSMTGYLTIKR